MRRPLRLHDNAEFVRWCDDRGRWQGWEGGIRGGGKIVSHPESRRDAIGEVVAGILRAVVDHVAVGERSRQRLGGRQFTILTPPAARPVLFSID